MTTPIAFSWDGEHMVPERRFVAVCNGTFVVGERYTLVEYEDRSPRSHDHYFALVNEAWVNLPESKAGRWATSEHLRKWALIKAGFRDETTFLASSKAEAARIAAFMKPVDDYAVVVAKGTLVVRWTAKSQSKRAMGKETFQASKSAVLAVLEEILEVEPGTLGTQTVAA